MKQNAPAPDTFNARWVPPEDVAETFVPIPQFRQLLHTSHSLLLGPRGCGKTTLLKMLTRAAQEKWDSANRAAEFDLKFDKPLFEAIYIPSDVRWSFEIRGIPAAIQNEGVLVLRTQRLMVAVNSIFHFLGTILGIFKGGRAEEGRICTKLIRRLSLENTLPTVRDIRCSLEQVAATVRGQVLSGNPESLRRVLDNFPSFLFGHALDPVTSVIRLVSEHLKPQTRPAQWALCYDELEIAPDWLRQELVDALRSGPQDILLKLTWSPILPSGLLTSPEATADFRPIRLWHSHVQDPKEFCENLARGFLIRKFGVAAPTPAGFFSRSILASEGEDEASKSYERGSTEYVAFRHLASWDKSFREVLTARGIDPNDPVPQDQVQKDEFFRKVKPIVLLRNEFTGESRSRSRKSPALYVGREAIYAISEGNPRWLLSLLNDLVDLGEPDLSGSHLSKAGNISYASQGRILTSASTRFRALIRASPFEPPRNIVQAADHTLWGFVELLGLYFADSIHNRHEFREDPTGSFEYPQEEQGVYSSMIAQLLELGALVAVGTSQQDVPRSIVGTRFRLSFMLAPIFRLPFRNFKAVSLTEIIRSDLDKRQLPLFAPT